MRLRAALTVSATCAVMTLAAVFSCSTHNGGDNGRDAASAEDTAAPPADSSPADAGTVYAVECTHPGKGKDLGNGTCECPQKYNMTGEWKGFYSCRDNPRNGCFDKNKGETFQFTQNGNRVHVVSPGGTFVMDGTICGDYFAWTGGEPGNYAECGLIVLEDADHYVKNSCYNNFPDAGSDGGASCTPAFETRCKDQTGTCTNTAARLPATAKDITNPLCDGCDPTCP